MQKYDPHSQFEDAFERDCGTQASDRSWQGGSKYPAPEYHLCSPTRSMTPHSPHHAHFSNVSCSHVLQSIPTSYIGVKSGGGIDELFSDSGRFRRGFVDDRYRDQGYGLPTEGRAMVRESIRATHNSNYQHQSSGHQHSRGHEWASPQNIISPNHFVPFHSPRISLPPPYLDSESLPSHVSSTGTAMTGFHNTLHPA